MSTSPSGKRPNQSARRPAKKRAAIRSKGSAVAVAAPSVDETELNLVPGLRDRIIKELDEGWVPKRERVARLMRITGRSTTATRRWLHPTKPGLPDLEAFYKLVVWFQSDVNYLLGVTKRRLTLPGTAAGEAVPASKAQPWKAEVVDAIGRQLDGCQPMVMRGDEMAPAISDGDIMFVDTSLTSLVGNGTYVIEFEGKSVVRNVEDRLNEGIVLGCGNSRYRETAVPRKAFASPSAPYRVVGKVHRTLKVAPV